tara:strand:- start:17 stop:199 length:183 start_codon:yes stop_codon:yes gene_type:complete
MQEFIDLIFNVCVYILQVIGNVTGMGYDLANLVIFVVIQPLLILIFFTLWRIEKKKNLTK